MEKSYGIEAARAQLGDIADHARTTGETIALTRHGRTVAIVGPLQSVKPIQGVEVTFLFPAGMDAGARLPGVPHKGDVVRRDNGQGEETWTVTEVEWRLGEEGGGTLYISLHPGDDYTQSVVAQWESERKTKRK
ncbi:type II toxin-antitoxin system Phd/YefM family antitoxin [Streptomyces collinus]|uniref:type II toxin-antitoxin system Phd/YefM family antitoxin n=1 Tax=Streptomyces collinus TaxID=42684 RepID=UPI0033C945CA